MKKSILKNIVDKDKTSEKKKIALYLDIDFYSKLKLIQIEENGDKTMNKFIISILENYLENHEK